MVLKSGIFKRMFAFGNGLKLLFQSYDCMESTGNHYHNTFANFRDIVLRLF